MENTPMHASAPAGQFTKREKNPHLELIPAGMHPAIIYGVINVGTHDNEYQGNKTLKNVLKICFEFPQHRQLYWADDTVPSPTSLIMDFNYLVSKNKKTGKKSNLLIFVETLYNIEMQESQYLQFDFSQLVGMKVFANVTAYTKLDGNAGRKITSVTGFNPQYVDPNTLIQTNPNYVYSVQMGFENKSFAMLHPVYRNMIKESYEGKAHLANGGRFLMLDDHGNLIIDNEQPRYTTAPLGNLVMTGQFTYDQLKANNWTDQQMIDNGYAKRESAPAVPQTPALPQAPQVPQIPQTPQAFQPQQAAPVYQSPNSPMALTPQMPLASSAPNQSLLTMIDKSAPYEIWIANGWTDKLLIEKGKAMMMTPESVAFPPSVPQAVPGVPQAIPQTVPAPQPTAAALFTGTSVAPIQNMGAVPPVPVPQPMSSFEQFSESPEPPEDDMPF